eukprot:m.50931 g.50931  ORF g.50931 m.50931 type:complete len:71 (+) comp11196_c0_seq2:747-959(+)
MSESVGDYPSTSSRMKEQIQTSMLLFEREPSIEYFSLHGIHPIDLHASKAVEQALCTFLENSLQFTVRGV